MSDISFEDIEMPDWSQVNDPTQDRTTEEVESDAGSDD